MWTIRNSRAADGERVVAIWADAVDATHGFLTPEHRAEIEAEVRAFLPGAPLRLAADDTGRVAGFALVADGHMEALFVDPACHGGGAGRALVAEAVAAWPSLTVDVNERNVAAIGFYRRLGFESFGRSDRDSAGRPYPLLHLRQR